MGAAAKSTASPPPGRRRRRWLGFLALALATAGASAYYRLTRDPEPYFARRHGTLIAVDEHETTAGGYAVREARLTSSSGLVVEIAEKRPLAAAGPLPLVLVLGGHRTGRDAVHLVDDTGGTVLAALSYPYAGDPKPRGLGVALALPAARRAFLDTPPALSLALDDLLARPYVDPARVELVGVSLGAPLVCVAGAVDPRFGRVWSLHGGGAPRKLLAHALVDDVPSDLLRAPLAAFGGLLVAQVTPERFIGRIAPRELVMVNAEDDQAIPRECVDSLYAAANEPKELLWIPGGHVEPGRREVIRELIEIVLGRILPAAP